MKNNYCLPNPSWITGSSLVGAWGRVLWSLWRCRDLRRAFTDWYGPAKSGISSLGLFVNSNSSATAEAGRFIQKLLAGSFFRFLQQIYFFFGLIFVGHLLGPPWSIDRGSRIRECCLQCDLVLWIHFSLNHVATGVHSSYNSYLLWTTHLFYLIYSLIRHVYLSKDYSMTQNQIPRFPSLVST